MKSLRGSGLDDEGVGLVGFSISGLTDSKVASGIILCTVCSIIYTYRYVEGPLLLQ